MATIHISALCMHCKPSNDQTAPGERPIINENPTDYTMGPKLIDDQTREAIQRKVYSNLVESKEVASRQQQASDTRSNTSAKDTSSTKQSSSKGNGNGARKDTAQQRRYC